MRIIGGKFRGRQLKYSGDLRTRPMKDRVREAIFNLVGPAIKGKHAVDLFAGTGALGLEAISRGAVRATLIERHFPTVKLIRDNIALLGLEDHVEVSAADTFIWLRQTEITADLPWVVFCSPPYDFYVDQQDKTLHLIETLHARAPVGSRLVVEADQRFDFALLPDADRWDVRRYSPAIVGIIEC